ncbi:hypothetical protein [Actinomyces culturomici]|uniref:hypothetical protein n=1 Tax=Actinomyces culturomici TaxID=1926276 RepID=UPI00135B8D0C|nr:hypothetical protein [Actinomyces culturomici]
MWFLWAVAMFTDTEIGRAANAIGGAFGRGVISGLFPLGALGVTCVIICMLIEPTGYFATIPGVVFFGLMSLTAVVATFAGLVVWIFDVQLPAWAYPEYYAARRAQGRARVQADVEGVDMIHVDSHPSPEGVGVRVTPELVSPNVLRVHRPWLWCNSALRSVVITVNNVPVGRIWNGQTRLFPLPKGLVAVFASLDWTRSNIVYAVLPAGRTVNLTLTFASPDRMIASPTTYMRLDPTDPADVLPPRPDCE